ncbi:CheR family methyltransferase [Archangium violaceum]|uniref:Chemotaxis protein CheR n=1 Tax=Archangium violaceum Cb vi76 TaxID=1406225 RepID=A0A084SLI3_9BACT|nr:protein-glutamate O-methyltransferase CheR [Archangium violaceum]KFA89318.1 chemotaxis protein CheR [Archangium violaceum Cb vi76]
MSGDSTQAWRHPGYLAVIDLVAVRAGLLPPSCPAAAMEGIDRAMARAGLSDFPAYLAQLEADIALLDDLLVELTIGETYFFRNPEHFQFVRHQVLPDVRRRRGPTHVVRTWSAGCASGEEPYSLAVLLLEEGYGERMEVRATDVSRAALARAQVARYGEWSLRGTEANRMRPFLHVEGKRYTLDAQVRTRVHFDYLNLADDTWPSHAQGIWGMDVIFCRNVLIYFNRSTIEAVARRLHASLADGGFLITGPSDPPLGTYAPFETILTDWGIVYHRPTAGEAPLRSFPTAPPPAPLPPFPPPVQPPAPPPVAVTPPMPAAPAPPPRPTALPALEGARRALEAGDWREAVRLAGALPEDAEAEAVAVRALANLEPLAAVRLCAEATQRHPLAAELRYLEALLLLGLGRLPESERAARQALYLEPSLAVAHLMLGHILRRQGDTAGARRSFHTAESLCASLPPETLVPLGDGERAGHLAEVARAERTRLEQAREEVRE